jgi:type IV secretion system protein TrbJ
MTPRLFALLAAAAPVLGAAVVAPSPASALPVFDAAKYQQNLLAAARALEQINHQIASLQNEARMIQQQARQLERLDFSALARLDGNFRKVDQLLGQARAIGFQVDRIESQMRGLFPGAAAGAAPRAARQTLAGRRLDAAFDALRGAIAMQAQVIENVQTDSRLIADLVAESQRAVGSLQAQQATNQLLALAGQQQLQLQAMLATQQRAQALGEARTAQAEIDGRAATRRFLGNGRAYTPR